MTPLALPAANWLDGLRASMRSGRFWLLAPALTLVALLVLLPVGVVMFESFVFEGELSLANYAQFFTSQRHMMTLQTTATISGLTTVVVMLLAMPFCAFVSTRSPRAVTIILAFVIVALSISGLIRTLTWQVVLSRQGPLNAALLWAGLIDTPLYMLFTRGAVVVGTAQVMLPYAIVVILTAMRRVDKEFVFMAQSMGSAPLVAFRYAYWPQIRRSIVNATLLVFVLSSGLLISPALLGGTADMMIGNVMLVDISDGYANGRAMAATSAVVLSLSLLGLAGLAMLLAGKPFNRRGEVK